MSNNEEPQEPTVIGPAGAFRIIPASDLAVGHAVILNDFDQPCSKMLAVITSKDDDGVLYAKYLERTRCSTITVR